MNSPPKTITLIGIVAIVGLGYGFSRWSEHYRNAPLVRKSYQTLREELTAGHWTNAWSLCTSNYRATGGFSDFTNLYGFIVKDHYALHSNSWVWVRGSRAKIYPGNGKERGWNGPCFWLDYEEGKWRFNGEA